MKHSCCLSPSLFSDALLLFLVIITFWDLCELRQKKVYCILLVVEFCFKKYFIKNKIEKSRDVVQLVEDLPGIKKAKCSNPQYCISWRW